MKKKYKEIIELSSDIESQGSIVRSQMTIGWVAVIMGAIFYFLAVWNISTKFYSWTALALFCFGVLALWAGHNGKKELKQLVKKLKELTKK